ncbi:hypothetical protein THRCLA_21073 [Thraustotheca clavata]|uniref:Guanylate cyclase domain-containing protein n=1 Tax=Thraustotheca clavata TaxID=74557 RepID=A0A1W0A0G8_9STRA|nr:hypothetical protein THRCLA_21073 [Thraustotheca clavata]
MSSFTAVVALFDISGFSTLADKLAREESHRASLTHESRQRSSVSGRLDTARTTSYRRISTTSTSSRRISGVLIEGEETLPPIPSNDKLNSGVDKAIERLTSISQADPSKKDIRTGMAVEQLTRFLNQTLAPVIDIITEYNGDIIKFAGDAMIVMWETESNPEAPPVDHGLLIQAAISCALKVLAMLKNQVNSTSVNRLGMHVGMGFSTITGNHVGGLLNRWEFYIAGKANQQMSIAERDADEGELVISPECYHGLLTSPAIEGLVIQATPLVTGNYRISNLESRSIAMYSLSPYKLSGDLIPCIKSYVPGCISLSLGKGKLVINGMRSITAIFIKFTEILDIYDPVLQLQEVHRCLCAVQDAAYRVHATIRQFLIDDKGAVAIVIVGLPPFYHENNALHGIRMALYMQEKGVKASIGITSGPAFCGSIGSAVRAEYAVVGDTINLSARLMSVATPGQILCDEATYLSTSTLFEFDVGSQVLVKGKGTTITVYIVYRDATTSNKSHTLEEIFLAPDIYDNVIKRIEGFVEQFSSVSSFTDTKESSKQLVLLRGPSGVGKSCLLRYLSKLHPNVVLAGGDSVEKNTQLHVWKKLISTIICGTNRVKAHRQEPFSHGSPASGSGFVVIGRRLSVPAADKLMPTKIDEKMKGLQSYNGSSRNVALSTLTRGVSWRRPSIRTTEVIVVNSDKALNTNDEEHSSCSSESDHDSNVPPLVSFKVSPRPEGTIALGAGLAFVNSIVQSGKISVEVLPLLNFFIPHCFPENSYTLALAANKEAHIKEIVNMVLAILQEVSLTGPILFALDDAQWIDPQSWDLLSTVLTLSPQITCVVAYRQDASPPHEMFKKLESAPTTFRWDLTNLSPRDTSLFLSHRFGIAIMNSYLLEFVHGRAHGNPRDTIALMKRLLELEAIQIDLERGVCHVLKDIHEVDMEISVQIRAKVLYHYDNLNTMSQLALHIASVSLDYISFQCLGYILRKICELEAEGSFNVHQKPKNPSEGTPPSSIEGSTKSATSFQSSLMQGMAGMGVCEVQGIVKLDRTKEIIEFVSSEMRSVVYNVMLPSQREIIHRVFAIWFECEVHQHRLPRFQYYHHLGYHLARCHLNPQAMDYFTRGAEEALLRGASDFALTCLVAAGDAVSSADTSHCMNDSSWASQHLGKLPPNPFTRDEVQHQVALYQCKIEYLMGLVMVQKSEWQSAIDHFQATIALHEELSTAHPKPWSLSRYLVQWWAPRRKSVIAILSNLYRRPHVSPSVRQAAIPLIDQVEAYVRIAQSLATKILTAEREQEKASNLIRLLGLKSIFTAKPITGTTSEATFVAFLPESRKRRSNGRHKPKSIDQTKSTSANRLPSDMIKHSSSKRLNLQATARLISHSKLFLNHRNTLEANEMTKAIAAAEGGENEEKANAPPKPLIKTRSYPPKLDMVQPAQFKNDSN